MIRHRNMPDRFKAECMSTAKSIVDAIFEDVRDRRFLKWLFDRRGEKCLIGEFKDGEVLTGLDLEVQEEIKSAWSEILLSFLWDNLIRPDVWQPIKTAPRDGTKILLCLTGYQPVVGHFDGENWEYQDRGDFVEEDHWLDWQEQTGDWFPDHWMPIPETPK